MRKIYILFYLLFSVGLINAQVTLTVTPNNGCAPLPITVSYFHPNGSNYYVSVSGNGYYQNQNTSATSLNFTLPFGGGYYVDVYAYDASGFYLGSNYQYINVNGLYPDAISSTAQQGSCPGDDINYWANVANYNNSNVSFDWDLGNGTTYSQIPYYSVSGNYPNAGTYTVTLTANIQGCGTYTATDTVTVSNNPAIIPSFSTYIWPNDSVCKGDDIHLGAPSAYYLMFDYGDGTYDNNSSGWTMPHQYQNNGTYIVSVTAMNGCGNYYTDVDTVYVVSGLPYNGYPPQINFNNGDSICPNTTTYFYANWSDDNILWNFGGNDTTSLTNPERSFPNLGMYPITLTAYNGCGASASTVDTLYVVNNLFPGQIYVNMTDSICPGSPFMVEASAQGYYNNGPVGEGFAYNFGDTAFFSSGELVSHIYNTPGTYTVDVSFTNGCGNSSTTQDTIYVGNSAGTQPSIFFMAPNSDGTDGTCPGDTAFLVMFPGGGNNTYQVDFGDGTQFSGTPGTLVGPGGLTYYIFKHAYTTSGQYTATLTYSSPCGGQQQSTATVNVSSSATMGDASFFYDDTKYYCLGDEYTFFAYGGNTYKWDFGDNTGTLLTTGVLTPVTHTFEEPGYYTVQMIITNGCGLKDTSEISINVPDTKIEIVTNQVKSTCGEEDGKAIAIVSGGTTPYSYTWTNGDNTFIADSLPAGIYMVNVTDKMGCNNYAIATVSDQEAPAILVNNTIDVSCFGGNDGVIDISAIGSSAPYSFVWSNGKTSEDVNNLVAGPYEVIVTDANGCVSTKSIFVNEPDDYTVSFTQSMPACGSSSGTITANVLGDSGPYYYLWSNGTNNAINSGLSAGVYNLTVVDSKGCLKDVTAVLNNQGAPAVAVDSVTALNCSSGGGASVYITAMGTGTLTYSWTNGTSAYSTADIINVPAGSYSLTVTGGAGCVASRVVDILAASPEGNPVCLVTVDTTTFTNKVVWEPVTQTDVESYNIYRESSYAGHYYLVGNVDADSLHQYIDPVADPSIRPWRYKISAVSACGVESEISAFHKTIHLTVNKGLTDSIYNLIWDDYEGQNTYTTYYIWRYQDTLGWQKIDSLSKLDHSYTDYVNGFSQLNNLYYQVEAGPLDGCDPARALINTSRSNVKQIVNTAPIDTSTIGMNEHEADLNFSIFPNPSKGQITVTGGKDAGKMRLEVTNVLGQIVYKEEAIIHNKIVDLSNMANGVYFVRLQKNDRSVSKKIILSR